MPNEEKIEPRKIKRYGWVPDIPDYRDQSFDKIVRKKVARPPSKFDLRDNFQPPYDQGELGSCVANSVGGAIQYRQRIQPGGTEFTPSRLFIYYNARVVINSVNEDSGSMIRDAIKSVSVEGAPPESLWPYNEGQFAVKPTSDIYDEALKHQALEYGRVGQTKLAIKQTIAGGYPVCFGFTVYSSFDEVDHTGKMIMPRNVDVPQGGHAVLAVGYTPRVVIVRNSWGLDWGDKGYMYMPWDYILNSGLSDDLWSINVVEE